MITRKQFLKENWLIVVIWNMYYLPILILIFQKIFIDGLFYEITSIFMVYFIICMNKIDMLYKAEEMEVLQKRISELEGNKDN